MKHLRIRWTPFAEESINQIHSYLLNKTKFISIANKFVLRLIKRTKIQSPFPTIGKIEPCLKEIGQNSKYIIEGNYKIIYEHSDIEVIITDVFHTKQNPIKIISRNNKT